MTDIAVFYFSSKPDDRISEMRHLFLILAEQMQNQPQSSLLTYTRQFREFINSVFKQFRRKVHFANLDKIAAESNYSWLLHLLFSSTHELASSVLSISWLPLRKKYIHCQNLDKFEQLCAETHDGFLHLEP
jgi:hypothetical protein